MLKGTDDEAFDAIMKDLALAFDRPHDVERVRVFWEALKNVPIHEVKRLAILVRKTGKRFPTPSQLMPEKTAAPVQHTSIEDPDVVARADKLSGWSRAANLILYHVAYCDRRRGLRPLGRWEPGDHIFSAKPIDVSLLDRCLAAKRDLVGAAEQDERAGQRWDEYDFNVTCREAFEKILGLTGVPMPDESDAAAAARAELRAAVHA